MNQAQTRQKLNTRQETSINQYSLAGKLALITGASRGIGRAIAVKFAENGAHLILIGRNENLLQSVQDEIQVENKNINCQIVAYDLQDSANFINQWQNLFGNDFSPDILVNNAGSFAVDSVSQKNRQIWDDTLAVHLTAAYELSCYFSQSMIKKKWGRIINISSISAQGELHALSYSTAKAGLIGLTKTLALELAKDGITVNAICPGWVETDMAFKQLNDPQWCKLNNIDPAHSIDIARLSSPQERMLKAGEIAHLTAFLCSQEAQGITGQSINICAGLSLT